MILPFDEKLRKLLCSHLDEVFASNVWSEGNKLAALEARFGELFSLHSVAVANGGAALLALLEYAGVRGKPVLLPANTFWATAQAVRWAGGRPVYVDCNRTDLCMSAEDLERKLTRDTGAVVVVHIGGHIAFEIERIAELCRRHGVPLVEDCAHAMGAEWHGRRAGSWGLGGAYSFYATKTFTTGEGGMVVTAGDDVADFVRLFRNYGKHRQGGKICYAPVASLNFRLSEITAALGLVQLDALPAVLDWKRELAAKYDAIFPRRVVLPEGMRSGYYKYIAFDQDLQEATGKVYQSSDQCHRIEETGDRLPNTDWVAEHHVCAPIYFGWPHAGEPPERLRSRLLA